MKITRRRLQRLIKESIRQRRSILLEYPNNPEERPYRYDDGDDKEDEHEGFELKKELFHMSQKSQQLHDIIMDDEDLEPWVQSKIAKAAAMMGTVFDHMMYEKHPGHVKE